MPALSANLRTRSGTRPGARNHGATTTRCAPWRRNPSSASASERSGGWRTRLSPPPTRAGHQLWRDPARARVHRHVGCADRHHEHTETVVDGDTPNSVTRRRSTDTSRSSSPSTAACRTSCGRHRNSRSGAGCRLRAWYALANSNGVTTAGPSTASSTSSRLGGPCSRKPVAHRDPVAYAPAWSTTARALAADRGSLLPCAVSTRVVTTRATRIRSWPVPASGRCAGRRPPRAWPCRGRSRSTDSPRRQAD